eukprot:1158443-Pelagomonas_calceolata.AAC.4
MVISECGHHFAVHHGHIKAWTPLCCASWSQHFPIGVHNVDPLMLHYGSFLCCMLVTLHSAITSLCRRAQHIHHSAVCSKAHHPTWFDDCRSSRCAARALQCCMLSTSPPHGSMIAEEYTVHSADITVLRAHFKGRLVLSGDAGGCWVLHQLLPPDQYKNLPVAANKSPISRAPSLPRCAYSCWCACNDNVCCMSSQQPPSAQLTTSIMRQGRGALGDANWDILVVK